MAKNLYVIETHDDIFLGTIELMEGGVLVRNGFPGHPRRIESEDIVQMFIAENEMNAENKRWEMIYEYTSKKAGSNYFKVG